MSIPDEAVEAAVKAWDHHWGDRYGDEALEEMGEEVRIALEAAEPYMRKPRQVTTIEELDKLYNSDGNVVLMDEDGLVLQNLAGGWGSPSFDNEMLTSLTLYRLFGPSFTVLHEVTAE
jgi:hypothetical protein